MKLNTPKLPNDSVIESEFFRRLSWRERFMILGGANLKIGVMTRLQIRQGDAAQKVVVSLSKEMQASEQVRSDAMRDEAR